MESRNLFKNLLDRAILLCGLKYVLNTLQIQQTVMFYHYKWGITSKILSVAPSRNVIF